MTLKQIKMKKILAFGSFDKLHDGHRQFLTRAKALGTYLVVAVAPDAVIQSLKNHLPQNSASQRIQTLKDSHLVDEVVLSDINSRSWNILKRVKPNIIALGFDQDDLRSSLEQHLEQTYPQVETTDGNWQSNPKKPKIEVLEKY
ncbi:MAG: FAD synthase [Candidatus Harrisonbacteria bacterium CG10_big_fil_rev_8_21_14_0_10_45_28]|uniref:FAD synthase n=1 Tax=Candidatus Harrisonbacteria bacterium CG10_big_fil_rev_8_21_14_0_10_45_28 TaxID=1974586 RepID=A0A2H0UR53_9BACT|nr:MAG: FAD synthase [Candidatus Harrisonbacteria bacterium CG10_big_fil_rev_8_21_14_0_10_45_28]